MHDYDILNLIRSEEIREYFRKNWKMNIEQKLSLVARSYVDISVKIEYLRHLAEQCDRKERALVLDMIKYMELGYRSITQPETSALYVLHILGYDGPDLDDEEDFDLNDTLDIYEDRNEYFIKYKEVIKYLEIERNGSTGAHMWNRSISLLPKNNLTKNVMDSADSMLRIGDSGYFGQMGNGY